MGGKLRHGLIALSALLAATPACRKQGSPVRAPAQVGKAASEALPTPAEMRAPLPAGLAEEPDLEPGFFTKKTFESGYQHVQSYQVGSTPGAWLSIESRSKEHPDERYLHMANKRPGGSLGVSLIDSEFDVREYPLFELDYRAGQGSKVSLLLQSDPRTYEIPLGNRRPAYPSTALRPLGDALEFKADGEWHHLKVDLGARFSAISSRAIFRVVLACVNDSVSGPSKPEECNKAGAWIDLDNVTLHSSGGEFAKPWTIAGKELALRPTLGTAGKEGHVYEWGKAERSLQTGLRVERGGPARLVVNDALPASLLAWTIALTGDGDQTEDLRVDSGGTTSFMRAGPDLRVYSLLSQADAKGHSALDITTGAERPTRINSVRVEPASATLFEIGELDGSNGEFANEMDVGDDYTAGTPAYLFERAVSVVDPATRIQFFLTREQATQPLYFQFTVHAWAGMFDKGGGQGVSLALSLNDQPIDELTVGRGPQTHFSVRMASGLAPGYNAITVRHRGGAEWLTWDQLALRRPETTETPDCTWLLQADTARPFALEAHGPEAFLIGTDPRYFRRAITVSQPVTHIVFELGKAAIAASASEHHVLIAEPAEWDRRDSGLVKFSVAINDRVVATPVAQSPASSNYQFATGKLLRPGANRVTLRWLGGSTWLTWKRVGLCRPSAFRAAPAPTVSETPSSPRKEP